MISLPTPRTAPLDGGPALRWGILGTGWIAQAWAARVHAHTRQRITAVASSDLGRAQAFASRHGIGLAFDDYARLVAHSEVDCVYIAGLNAQHLPHAKLAIAAGKHVLVEKPLGSTAVEAREIAQAARAAGVFAMEAMWTRFLPQTDVLLRMIEEGDLGEIGLVEAAFARRMDPAAAPRVFAGGVHGGALLDLGVYPLAFAHAVLGPAERMLVSGTLLDSGVDGRSVLLQEYPTGARSVSVSGVDLGHLDSAAVIGTRGSVRFPERFYGPSGFVYTDGESTASFTDPNGWSGLEGLAYQVAAFASDVGEGLTESVQHPLDTSIAVLERIDEARRQLGAPTG